MFHLSGDIHQAFIDCDFVFVCVVEEPFRCCHIPHEHQAMQELVGWRRSDTCIIDIDSHKLNKD
jgi:hypothetical protein